MSLFKSKSSRSRLDLPVVGNPAEPSLERKLAMETRTCPQCSFAISNPMTDRCPRCFGLVPLSEHTNCGECSHQGNCVFKQMEK